MNRTESLPMVALRGMTILPEMVAHFDISRERSIEAAAVPAGGGPGPLPRLSHRRAKGLRAAHPGKGACRRHGLHRPGGTAPLP